MAQYSGDDLANIERQRTEAAVNESMSRRVVSFDMPMIITKPEKINHPSHYNAGKFEAIEVIEDWKLGFSLGNAVKYIARAGKKDGSPELEDLKKAQWYLARRIKELSGE